MTPNRKVTFSWSVSCLFCFFLKSCLLFHFLHFYFLLLFPCFFCCPMIFASVLLSVLPLVVLTCVPLPFCINSVCLPFPCVWSLFLLGCLCVSCCCSAQPVSPRLFLVCFLLVVCFGMCICLIHRLCFARIILATYYYHYLPTNRSSDLGQ